MTTFDRLQEYLARPEAGDDIYVLEDLLLSIPEGDRAQAERTAIERLGRKGRTLGQLKTEHAFGIALGRPLKSFPPGLYALHAYNADGLFVETGRIIPEAIEAIDCVALANYFGGAADDYRVMTPAKLRALLVREGIVFRSDDGMGQRIWLDRTSKIDEADSLYDLLKANIDMLWPTFHEDPDDPPDRELTDDALARSGSASFAAIRDLRYRRLALHVSGAYVGMGVTYTRHIASSCGTALILRPGWEFVLEWEPRSAGLEGGLCVLRRRCDDGGTQLTTTAFKLMLGSKRGARR